MEVIRRLNVQPVHSETMNMEKTSMIVVPAQLVHTALLSAWTLPQLVVRENSVLKVLLHNRIAHWAHTMMTQDFMTHVVARHVLQVVIVHSLAKMQLVKTTNVMQDSCALEAQADLSQLTTSLVRYVLLEAIVSKASQPCRHVIQGLSENTSELPKYPSVLSVIPVSTALETVLHYPALLVIGVKDNQ